MPAKKSKQIILITLLSLLLSTGFTQSVNQRFFVLGFFTAKQDLAHISFVHEANHWFSKIADQYGFRYDSTNDWSKLNRDTLAKYQLVIFLDTRPEDPAQRAAFQQYMEKGGGWMGFHFSAFALTPSAYPQNWNWYHNEFIGAGQYASNTWRPVSATLRLENNSQPATRNLPTLFKTAPCEWYRWEKDLRRNPDIDILLSIDSSSFPLGTGPKPHEIWHSGYYPVVWTNKKYRMIYLNMGHNDMDYGGTNQPLSSSFSSEAQNKLIIDAVLWLGGRK